MVPVCMENPAPEFFCDTSTNFEVIDLTSDDVIPNSKWNSSVDFNGVPLEWGVVRSVSERESLAAKMARCKYLYSDSYRRSECGYVELGLATTQASWAFADVNGTLLGGEASVFDLGVGHVFILETNATVNGTSSKGRLLLG